MTLDAALDLLLGGACHGCGRPGRSPCVRCRTQLRPAPHLVYRPALQGFAAPVVAALQYQAPLRELIVAYKNQQAWQLTGLLGSLLFAAVEQLPNGVLVPVPSQPARVRARGFDHTATLSSWVARRAKRTSRALLTRSRVRVHQARLGADDRLVAQTRSMRAKPCDQPVIVVDDVITTGATLAEAIRALEEAGAQVIGVGLIAATPLQNPNQ